jgi:histidinol dehydrogenase
MNKIYGINKAKDVLLKSRGFDLQDTPEWISESSERIFGQPLTLHGYVQKIIEEVKFKGDSAIKDITEKIDGTIIDNIKVHPDTIEKAYNRIPIQLKDALYLSADRINDFHSLSMPNNWNDFSKGYGQKFIPVESIGAYIPGGTASYPSTVLMTCLPAQIAGVEEISITCPNINGVPTDAVLAAAFIAGVRNVYSIGGAQAIAAFAYGTESVNPVNLICGPGNIFVTMAKKLLYGDVGLDGHYGPTETIILADNSANPVACAADLIAQSEHDVLAQSILITTSTDFADQVIDQIDARISNLDRFKIIETSLRTKGFVVIVDDLLEGIELSNAFAPEHLTINTENPDELVPLVKNAGMVFIGEFSHEVLGDYGAGPSHVMPTSGTAKFNSGLGVHTFLKTVPFINLNKEDALSITDTVVHIANEEGLTAHAQAAEIRRELE